MKYIVNQYTYSLVFIRLIELKIELKNLKLNIKYVFSATMFFTY